TSSSDTGFKPATIHFDASSSSDADSIDHIGSYTFNFGDGSDDVTQTTPTIDYTFTSAGMFAVKVVVTDSRGKTSSNTAQRIITIYNKPAITSITPSSVCKGSQAFNLQI